MKRLRGRRADGKVRLRRTGARQQRVSSSSRRSRARVAEVNRATRETEVRVELDLDGRGGYRIETGMPFFDHMLESFARHGFFDLTVTARGDLAVDTHHTIEDVGLALGQAFREALGDKAGICRFGEAQVPLDDALVEAVVDLSGRPYLVYDLPLARVKIGAFDAECVGDFLQALMTQAGMNLHLTCQRGHNPHHIVEAAFKALARALDSATRREPRLEGVLSTKGVL